MFLKRYNFKYIFYKVNNRRLDKKNISYNIHHPERNNMIIKYK